MSALKFRNITASVDDPVETWPFEGILAAVTRSGLSRQDFALRLGTSRPRLSTYMSGKVTPSASLMLRMRRVAAQAQAGNG
jgi:DNA-binding transcriptional regulator YiaG